MKYELCNVQIEFKCLKIRLYWSGDQYCFFNFNYSNNYTAWRENFNVLGFRSNSFRKSKNDNKHFRRFLQMSNGHKPPHQESLKFPQTRLDYQEGCPATPFPSRFPSHKTQIQFLKCSVLNVFSDQWPILNEFIGRF